MTEVGKHPDLVDNRQLMLHPLLALIIIVILALRPASLAGSPPPSTWNPDVVPDAFTKPTAALMWPAATRAFFVDAGGDLGNGAWRGDITAAADGRLADAPRRIAYEDRWLPVAHWTEHAGDVRWDFEAVALPIPEGPIAAWNRDLNAWRAVRMERETSGPRGSGVDTLLARPRALDPVAGDEMPLVVTVRARAHNDGPRAERATLDVTLAPPRPADASRPAGWRAGLPPCGWWTARADSAMGWSDGAVEGLLSWRNAAGAGGAFAASRHAGGGGARGTRNGEHET